MYMNIEIGRFAVAKLVVVRQLRCSTPSINYVRQTYLARRLIHQHLTRPLRQR
jgi:hypothetical protein